MDDLEEALLQRYDRFESDLFALLRRPSVSTDPVYRDDVHAAGEWLTDHLARLGLTAELIPTEGHPIVVAETPPVPGRPVALVYGHYDVQPPDPLNLWTSPPFEPTVRNGNVYARGATDDKGQMLTHVKSVETWLATRGELPLQVKFLIEGEEEVGSGQLHQLLPQLASRLACDVVVISDTCQFAPGQPVITYGLRGIAYFELYVQGPCRDLHSGSFGGAVTNPLNALATMLSAIIDSAGKIQVPRFYDNVEPLTERERNEFQNLPFDEKGWKEQLGVTTLAGEEGYSTLERRWGRPTFDIHGLRGGYQGEGAKTVLPAEASCKFSFRLVPHQDPADVEQGLRELLEQIAPPGITWRLDGHHGNSGFVVPLGSPYIAAAAAAIESGFGTKPVFIREGGSIPIVNELQQHLGAETLLLGWGLDDDNTHSPNEKFCLDDFRRGIRASIHLWDQLGRIES